MRLGSRNSCQGDRRNRQMFLKRPGVESVFSEEAASCERLRNFAMSLRWWQNSKRWETIQRSSKRSSAALLKKESASVHCHPTARAPMKGPPHPEAAPIR
jgi:hypothetical protein